MVPILIIFLIVLNNRARVQGSEVSGESEGEPHKNTADKVRKCPFKGVSTVPHTLQ
jgi:hypothetical protein